MKVERTVIQTWLLACLVLLLASCTATGPKCGQTTSAIVRAKLTASDPAHLDMYETELLAAAGGGKLEDHLIGRVTTPMDPKEREYEFFKSSSKSMKPFTGSVLTNFTRTRSPTSMP